MMVVVVYFVVRSGGRRDGVVMLCGVDGFVGGKGCGERW